ncbi:glycosyltransferase [Pseudoalteromonas sp. SG45-6]|uniref:glycosyltransferase n=1 Tax=Pseudoalteromonas sp. SG45-6 TaxID=2760953 RepID=UPI0015FF3A90|nr:glycosyltransferase [Pseudoalteromonas sp. SG45-6]MBB1358236.1 glycosyltransferase [Pseudoalteromonas sp. SG45-6]
MTSKNMIFHHPLPLNYQATSASGIRPIKMLNALKSLGYKVDLVTGYSAERKKCIKKIKNNIEKGLEYDFVYSESSTMPTILTDRYHLPLNPLLDFGFFKFCKRQNIKIGLFYRDIYWAFEGYGNDLNLLKIATAKLAYKYDLKNYNKYLTKLYLPSLEMGKYVPIVNGKIFEALPPGSDSNNHFDADANLSSSEDEKLNIFYVGGMSEHYQMHLLFKVVSQFPKIILTICTRENEWLSVKDTYPALTDNIKIVHKVGEDMKMLMQQADIVSVFVKPHEYWEFAAPVKLYEYLGSRKPILASNGTLAANFVKNNKIGWAIDYKPSALTKFFVDLVNDRQKLVKVKGEMNAVAEQHTWVARAKQVQKDLKNEGSFISKSL